MVDHKITIDTSAYIYMTHGNAKIRDIVESASVVFIPVTVLGELKYGFNLGSRKYQNLEGLNRFLSLVNVRITLCSEDTADIYGYYKAQLKQIGRPIPDNDVWIAAQASENGSILVTFEKHFNHIPGLRIYRDLFE